MAGISDLCGSTTINGAAGQRSPEPVAFCCRATGSFDHHSLEVSGMLLFKETDHVDRAPGIRRWNMLQTTVCRAVHLCLIDYKPRRDQSGFTELAKLLSILRISFEGP